MRSAAVAWLLDLYGYKVIQLTGGYKAYRNWVLEQFTIPYSLKVVGGYTGSGKTEIFRLIAKLYNAPFIRVEATRYTEVGYHGDDITNIIVDLFKKSKL
jgi:tRNA 2-selenouridine synthase